MEIRSLEQLREPDPRTQAFTPHGLGMDRILTPESAAEFQQRVIGRLELTGAVADGTRRSFERLRTIYAYGVLCYDVFTLVNDAALLVLEQALRDRFVTYHQHGMKLVDPDGEMREIQIGGYEHVRSYFKRNRRKRLRLVVGDSGATIAFRDGMLSDLRVWARAAGLLRGQRNRFVEDAMAALRNEVAHPNGYNLLSPVDAARTVTDLAEIINQLWGEATENGRLYPTPMRREILTLARTPDGVDIAARAERLADDDAELLGAEHLIVRAVFHDPDLHWFQGRWEATSYPADWLWGPGSADAARDWLRTLQPAEDSCDYLDRVFAVHHVGADLYLPMTPDAVLALPDADRSGSWHIVRADHPDAAFTHVKNRVLGLSCQQTGPCDNCPAELLAQGAFPDIAELLKVNQTNAQYVLPPELARPRARAHKFQLPEP
ncbi:hypothetical protein AB0F43_11035 [Kribbella sp. NPDC023972]|uniref:hypothetical protein n=1 Tax=Kribbella sp. NPDC023972 TaxID=3154795 RepID=UPI0033DE5782